MLLVVLHDDQAANAERVATAKLHRPPLYVKAHGARVIIELRNVRQDLSVHLGADGFGKMLGELWILHLAREGGLYTQRCSLIEFCNVISGYRCICSKYFRKATTLSVLFKIFTIAL